MLLTYSITVDAFKIVLRSLPQEILLTDLLIVYRMHEADLEVKNADILAHKEVTFILNVPSRELTSEYVIMKISAYKYHPTGLKVLIGNIEVNIKVFIDFALMRLGEIVPVSGNHMLRNPGKVNGADLSSTIRLVIVDDTELGFGEGELFRQSPRDGNSNNINRAPKIWEIPNDETTAMQTHAPW